MRVLFIFIFIIIFNHLKYNKNVLLLFYFHIFNKYTCQNLYV